MTAGVLGLELDGDEVGDELRARFFPLRVNMGEMIDAKLSLSVCHKRRSLGGESSSSLEEVSFVTIRSCHASLASGVAVLGLRMLDEAAGDVLDCGTKLGAFSLSDPSSMVITVTPCGRLLCFGLVTCLGPVRGDLPLVRLREIVASDLGVCSSCWREEWLFDLCHCRRCQAGQQQIGENLRAGCLHLEAGSAQKRISREALCILIS